MASPITPQLNSSILDLSQRTITKHSSDNVIDQWTSPVSSDYTDALADDEFRKVDASEDWNIEQPLTDQMCHTRAKEDSLSDSASINKSQVELTRPRRRPP